MITLAVFVGLCIGLVAADYVHRQRALHEIETGKKETKEVLSKLSETHNALMKTMLDLQEVVSAHEFKLNGKPLFGK